MIGSTGPWIPLLKRYQDEVTSLLNWYNRKQKGARPIAPIADSLAVEAESRGISRLQLVDRIRDYVTQEDHYSDNSVQALIHEHDWDALSRMLYTNMATTWQDRSAEGASVRVAHSAMHRVKDTWFEYIRSAPVQSESGSSTGDLNLKMHDVEFKVRKGADQEVERRKDEAQGTLALDSPVLWKGRRSTLMELRKGGVVVRFELKEQRRSWR